MKNQTKKEVLAYWTTLALSYFGTFVAVFIFYESRGEPKLLGSIGSAHKFAFGATITHSIALMLVFLPWVFLSEKKKRMRDFPLIVGYMVMAAWSLVFIAVSLSAGVPIGIAAATVISLTYGLLSGVVCGLFLRIRFEPGEIVNASAAAGLSENHLHD